MAGNSDEDAGAGNVCYISFSEPHVRAEALEAPR
jgi:hypothetical protein